MIVFNIDSAPYICDILKNKSKQLNISFFFNDGLQLQQVTGFKNIEDYFDVNGMTQTVITGYKIQLNGGNELTIKLDGTQNRVMPFTSKTNTKSDYGISNKVSKFLF
ncbi:hypothetical protein MD588_08595 [Photobacterium sp. SDRW27]|uniref:hypothetical protein n=1 Tax=Photobacterium obscurum TaxID=2829490 RepID=UPI0022440C34|nr:hypothetical protein [Photobacterium obscurum]MCW8328866.1 hypothetical protein [Photobacterium obscurum]